MNLDFLKCQNVVESGVKSEGLCITYEYIFVYGFHFRKPLSVYVSKVSEGEDFLGYYGGNETMNDT